MYKKSLVTSSCVMFVFLLLLLTSVFFVLPKKIEATTFFTTPVPYGTNSLDTYQIQKLLNTSNNTQVASTGPGSPGQETVYYGPLTKQAILRFQLQQGLYGSDLAQSVTLGVIDTRTLIALNDYAASINFFGLATTNPFDQNATTTLQPSEQDTLNNLYRASITVIPGVPYIDQILPKTVTIGDTITIYGRNFSTSSPNIIRMTFNDIYATSTDGTTLTVQAKSSLQTMFDDQTKNLSDDDKNKVKKKIPDIPLFITVQNEKSISNPYQIYIKIK